MGDQQLIIRITFRSGAVSEQVGTDAMVDDLFDQDSDRLIDHVLTLDPSSGDNQLVTHLDDERFDDLFEPEPDR